MKINKEWSLFLDRDGVINHRLPGDYVKKWEEFQFQDRVLEAMSIFSTSFQRIVVVTNQKGVGMGIMSAEDLDEVHQRMKMIITNKGGRIDKIYYCPDLATVSNNCRKPSPAMAYQAKKDFPEIDFSKSIMVGDAITDLYFGQGLHMKTVLIETYPEQVEKVNMATDLKVDFRCKSLWEFAHYIKKQLP